MNAKLTKKQIDTVLKAFEQVGKELELINE